MDVGGVRMGMVVGAALDWSLWVVGPLISGRQWGGQGRGWFYSIQCAWVCDESRASVLLVLFLGGVRLLGRSLVGGIWR